MNTTAISLFGPLYEGGSVTSPPKNTNSSPQRSFAGLLQNCSASVQAQSSVAQQPVTNIMQFFQDLGAALQVGSLSAAQEAFNGLEQSLKKPSATVHTASESGQPAQTPTPSVAAAVAQPNITAATAVTPTVTATKQQEALEVAGTATGESDWYQKVVQPLVDSLPSEVRETYEAAWHTADIKKAGGYMYGMTPAGSLIGDFAANLGISAGEPPGGYSAWMLKGMNQAAIEQSLLDTAAFTAANQAILDKYSYDLRLGDIRIGTGEYYTVYNPVNGARGTVDLRPAKT